MKFISNTLLVSLILLTLSASSTQAIDPNKFSCGWDATRNPPCFVDSSTCDANHTPGSCELIPNEAVCEPSRIRDCLTVAPPPTTCTTRIQCTSATECIDDAADGSIDCFLGCNVQGSSWGCTQPPPPPGPVTHDGPFCGTSGVFTALGCLEIGNANTFIAKVVVWAIGIGGGVALLLILYASFQLTTAAGNPKQVQAAKEILTAAVSGLVLLIVPVVLLNLIGINLLGLPGF